MTLSSIMSIVLFACVFSAKLTLCCVFCATSHCFVTCNFYNTCNVIVSKITSHVSHLCVYFLTCTKKHATRQKKDYLFTQACQTTIHPLWMPTNKCSCTQWIWNECNARHFGTKFGILFPSRIWHHGAVSLIRPASCQTQGQGCSFQYALTIFKFY